MSSIDELISASLLDLAAYIAKNAWRGREREVVSLYAFGFLAPRASQYGVLRHPTQIGIEVSVRQQSGTNRKALVCKDLVIWPDAASTVWDIHGRATRDPLAILEWKARVATPSEADIEWLCAFSRQAPDSHGYAAALNPNAQGTTLNVARIRSGEVERNWLTYPA